MTPDPGGSGYLVVGESVGDGEGLRRAGQVTGAHKRGEAAPAVRIQREPLVHVDVPAAEVQAKVVADLGRRTSVPPVSGKPVAVQNPITLIAAGQGGFEKVRPQIILPV